MRLFAFLPFIASVLAGGQPTRAATAQPAAQPSSTGFKFPSLDLEAILTSGPVASMLAKTGLNIAEKLQEAKKKAAETDWLDAIPLITDENYESLIVNEILSPEEEDKRVWFLAISIPNKDQLTKFVDTKFDATYNISRSTPEKALPHVKWGRINYLDVTKITTRWWVWRAPLLVVLRHHGQEVRFYSARTLRLEPEILHRFLQVEGWKETEPWSGAFAPGGSLAFYMDVLAIWSEKSYNFINSIPRWILLMGTGALASFLVTFLHPTKPATIKPPTPAVTPAVPVAPAAKPVSTAKRTQLSQAAKLDMTASETSSGGSDRESTASRSRRETRQTKAAEGSPSLSPLKKRTKRQPPPSKAS